MSLKQGDYSPREFNLRDSQPSKSILKHFFLLSGHRTAYIDNHEQDYGKSIKSIQSRLIHVISISLSIFFNEIQLPNNQDSVVLSFPQQSRHVRLSESHPNKFEE